MGHQQNCNVNVFLFQVSRLVILHEEAEDGNAMPDLTIPVQVVSRAVDNLIKVSEWEYANEIGEPRGAWLPKSFCEDVILRSSFMGYSCEDEAF